MNDQNEYINELLGSTIFKKIPNIIQELFHQLNNKIDSLSNKLDYIEHNNEDMVSKDLLNTMCATKVDINDFMKTVNNIDQHIKQKPSIDDIKYLSEDKISKSEINELLLDYMTKKEYNTLAEEIPKSFDLKDFNQCTNSKIDSMILELNKKINNLPTFEDIAEINNILQKKADFSEIQDILSDKIDKSDVNKILNSKVDYKYIDEQLNKKMDIFIWDKIQNDMSTKASLEDFDKLQEEIDKKVNMDIVNKLINNKTDRKYMEEYLNNFFAKEHEINDSRFKALDIDFDRFIESVKSQFNQMNQVINKMNKDKVDKTYIDEKLGLKLDTKKLLNELDKFDRDYKMKLNDISIKNKEGIESTTLKMNQIKMENDNKYENIKDDLRKIIQELSTVSNNVKYNFDMMISEKNSHEFFKNEITNKFKNIFEKIESTVDSTSFNKSLLKSQEDLKNIIMNNSQEKISYKEFENMMKAYEDKNNECIKNIQKNYEGIFRDINSQLLSLTKDKICMEQCDELVNKKMNEINNTLIKYASVNDFLGLSNKVKQISDNVSKKLNQEEFVEYKKKTNDSIGVINKELSNRYNKEEENELFNTKCNLNNFNSVIKEISSLIDTKVDLVEYQKFTDIQEVINNIYLTENSTGVWKWVSSKLNNDYIPLEVEYYNTMRDNYLWEEDRTSLMIVNKGVYEIKIVIFTDDTDAKITLVVNGENIIQRGREENIRGGGSKIGKFCLKMIKIDEILNIYDKVRIAILFDGKNNNSKGYLKISSVHFEQDKDIDIKNTKYIEDNLSNNKMMFKTDGFDSYDNLN